VPNQRESVTRTGRGGPRPGAGAPRGNLNALKHGRRSTQFSQLGLLLAANPKIRDALLALARRHQIKQRRADEVAALLFTRLFQHARQVAAGRPSHGPFASLGPDRPNAQRQPLNDAQSNEAPSAPTSPNGTRALRSRNHRSDNQTANHAPPINHRPNTESATTRDD